MNPALKERFRFLVSPHFEVFHALELLCRPGESLHPKWLVETRDTLRRHGFPLDEFASPLFWALQPDTLSHRSPCATFTELLLELAHLPEDTWLERLLGGLLHDDDAARRVARGQLALADAIVQAPAKKREWLTTAGVYPPTADNPFFGTFLRLLPAPGEFQRRATAALDHFWNAVFSETWRVLEPRMQVSAAEKRRLFEVCTLAEFGQQLLLKLTFDDAHGEILAAAGGYRLSYSEIDEVCVLPSAFNASRFWSAHHHAGGTRVAIPFFDPAISVAPGESAPSAPTPTDPALLLRALADPSRLAMVGLLARGEASTATELAAALKLSKATLSHHVEKLRVAGVVRCSERKGVVTLTVEVKAIASLSHQLLAHLGLV